MKWRVFALVLILLPLPLFAQNATITATVTGSDGCAYQNGTYNIVMVDSTGRDLTPGTIIFIGGTQSYVRNIQGTLDGFGKMNVSLLPNNAVTSPAGTQWKFNISSQNPVVNAGTIPAQQSFKYTATINTSQDITAALGALAPPLNCHSGGGGGGGTIKPGSQHALPYYDTPATGTSVAPTLATVDASGNLNASVNTQVNVQMFGAKGDCVTDDNTAITNAQTAAIALAAGQTTPAALYFPKPPGGCYLTSTIQWLGVSLLGQPSSTQNANGGVTIQGKSGQDILHVQDPTTNSTTYQPNWVIENINFRLDDSSAGSFPHRWFGRWFDDATMTSGSAILKTSNAAVSCGDIGQPVQVNGAGPAGANLVTTISSVFPCWNNSTLPSFANYQRITLAASASTNVTNAHAFISVLGLSVTQNVGAAAIAFDDKDANAADWVNPSNGVGGLRNVIRNVNFTTVNGGLNATVAIFTQGQQVLYALLADHVNVQGIAGIIQTCSEINSSFGSCSGDYQRWTHINFSSVYYPFIEYNGLHNRYEDIQLGPVNYGPQFLQLANINSDFFNDAILTNIGYEQGSYTGTTGWRVEGNGLTFTNVSLTGSNSQTAILDTSSSTFVSTTFANVVDFNGRNNRMYGGDSDISSVSVVNGGVGNYAEGTYFANPLDGLPFNTALVQVPTKGPQAVGGRFNSDFLLEGNTTTPYTHDDFMVWPHDILLAAASNPFSNFYADDATSPTGGYTIWNSGWSANTFAQFFAGPVTHAGHFVPTLNIPAGSNTVYWLAKCASPGTSTMTFRYFDGASFHNISTSSFSCTTTWTVFSARLSLAGLNSSDYIDFSNQSATSFFVGWLYVRPDSATLNNISVPPSETSNTQFTTGPSSSTTNDVVTMSNTTGAVKDSGTQLSALMSNPMTTLGDTIYGGSSGTPTRLAGNTTASTLCLVQTGTGSVSAAPSWGACSGSAATAFNAITSGTNTTATMTVGTGGSLLTSGSGTIAATSLTALTGMPAQSGDSVVMNATGSSAAPTAVSMPTGGTNGCAGSTNALLYNTTTHAWSCSTSAGGITQLTGDVTAGPGSGSQAATIPANTITTAKINAAAVTLAKIQNAGSNSILVGSGQTGSGSSYSEIALGTGLAMSGTTLNVTGTVGGFAGTVTYTVSHTLGSADNGFLVIMNCSSACTLTLPNPQPSSTFLASVVSIGTNTPTLALGSSMTWYGGSSLPVLLKYNMLPIAADSGTTTNYIGQTPLVAGTNCTITSAATGQTISCPIGGGARKGTFVCTGGGTISISNTNETATSDVIISMNTAGGTITTPPAMKTVTGGTGFSVLCGATDTSTYNYNILD